MVSVCEVLAIMIGDGLCSGSGRGGGGAHLFDVSRLGIDVQVFSVLGVDDIVGSDGF